MKMYYLNNLKSGISVLIGLICAISIPLSAFAAEEDEDWDKGWWDARCRIPSGFAITHPAGDNILEYSKTI